jgi:hypothetical protein
MHSTTVVRWQDRKMGEKEGGGKKGGVAGLKDRRKRGVVASKALDGSGEVAGQRRWSSQQDVSYCILRRVTWQDRKMGGREEWWLAI